MRSLTLFTLGLATSFASLSTAHTVLTTLFVDGVNQGDGTCIRMPKDGNVATFPIAGIDSPDMACGRDGQSAVAFTCPTTADSTLTLEYRMWADAAQPGAIDPSHRGPIAIYLKSVSNINTDSAAGPGWFKIYDEGYNEATNKWATERLIDDNGLLSIKLPSALPTGYYLARSEILTLQNVTNNYVDPQFYVGCTQLFIRGLDNAPPLSVPSSQTVSIPGHVNPSDPGLTFNIYTTPLKLPYIVPGPAAYFPTTSQTKTNTKAASSSESQTQGVIPKSCILKNANWCATNPPSYTTESTCWASSENCYNQLKTCYDSAPPTGSRGCRQWDEQMCTPIQEACKSGNWQQGPPGGGEVLGDVTATKGGVPAAVNEGEVGEVVKVVDAGQESAGESGTGNAVASSTAVAAAAAVSASTTSTSAAATAAASATGTKSCRSRRQRRQRRHRRRA